MQQGECRIRVPASAPLTLSVRHFQCAAEGAEPFKLLENSNACPKPVLCFILYMTCHAKQSVRTSSASSVLWCAASLQATCADCRQLVQGARTPDETHRQFRLFDLARLSHNNSVSDLQTSSLTDRQPCNCRLAVLRCRHMFIRRRVQYGLGPQQSFQAASSLAQTDMPYDWHTASSPGNGKFHRNQAFLSGKQYFAPAKCKLPRQSSRIAHLTMQGAWHNNSGAVLLHEQDDLR